MWAGDCATVLHARPGARLRRTKPPTRFGVMRLRPARMALALRPDLPDEDLDRPFLTPPLQDVPRPVDWKAYLDLRSTLRWPGLASPREHRLLAYLDRPNGDEGPCYARTKRTGPRLWRHLSTVGWDGVLRFRVADLGRLQLAIAARDLRHGRCDRVCGLFDSA